MLQDMDWWVDATSVLMSGLFITLLVLIFLLIWGWPKVPVWVRILVTVLYGWFLIPVLILVVA